MHKVRIANGYLHLTREVCQTYFPGIKTVVLMARLEQEEILVLPVHNEASGGLLMKQKNVRGDCVVAGMDFLRFNGFEDSCDIECPVEWDSSMAALKCSIKGYSLTKAAAVNVSTT